MNISRTPSPAWPPVQGHLTRNLGRSEPHGHGLATRVGVGNQQFVGGLTGATVGRGAGRRWRCRSPR
jgi:hypothetical protein